MLFLSGIISYEDQNPEDPFRIPYIRTCINWNKFIDFIQSPLSSIKDNYNWNKQDLPFDWEKLLSALHHVVLNNRFLSRYNLPRQSVVESFSQPEYAKQYNLHELSIPIISGFSILEEIFYFIGFGIMPIGRDGQSTPPDGLLITPIIRGNLEHEILLSPEISFDIAAAAAARDVFGIKLFPDGVTVAAKPGNAEISAKFGLIGNSTYEPWIIFGDRDGHRLELHGFTLDFRVEGKANDPEVSIRFRTKSEVPEKAGVQLVIQMNQSDSFLQKTTKDQEKVAGGFDLEIVWSSKTGLHFSGRPDFNLELPLNKKLGPIELTQFYLALRESLYKGHKKSFQLRSGLGIKGHFGPVTVQLENTGISLDFIPYTHEEVAALPPSEPMPLMGLLDLDFGFAPPLGVGLSINAKSVTGGGYLYCDPTRGEYMGVAQLNIKNKINLKAFGVVLTKPQFSFLLMVSAEFPPIQLGLGFKLTGVGGLIGIHRRIELAKLTEGLRTNQYDDILFPQAPLENPYGLLTKINSIFPAAEDQYVVGLMGMIAWGPMNLVTIELGLIMEFPEPVRLALVGLLKAVVRKEIGGEERTVLQLQVNFLGILDFEKRFIRFDATLFESNLLGLKLEGDMALRVKYGSSSDFALTVGGFHPNFQPPALDLPAEMRRLQITLRSGNPSITVAAYVAITPNTFQFGVAGLFRFEKWGVKILGELTFDALFQFSPFRFEVGVHFLLSASWKGYEFAAIEIDGLFAGPSPWHIDGNMRLKVWIFSKTVHIEETWGDDDNTRLEPVRVLPLLVEDLSLPGNWENTTGRTRVLATIRSRKVAETTADSLFLHPNELITIRQNTVPLGLKIDKFGERTPEGASTFHIELTDSEDNKLAATPVKNHFAPAQFVYLADEQKLQSPSYELFESGLGFEGMDDVLFSSFMTDQAVEYETMIVDVPGIPAAETKKTVKESESNFNFALRNNALANSPLGIRARPFKAPARPIAETYTVVDQTLKDFADIQTGNATQARQILRDLVRKNPRKQKELTVLLKGN
ncbi:MAG: hypothetical protein H6563_11990 [Lewinellaceae bacterium]|nr:hypothetical protein [Lewinellaceae bacterium]